MLEAPRIRAEKNIHSAIMGSLSENIQAKSIFYFIFKMLNKTCTRYFKCRELLQESRQIKHILK